MGDDGRPHRLDETGSWLDAIRQVVYELRTGPRIKSDQPFSDPFVRAHTQFDSYAAFRRASPWRLDESTAIGDVPAEDRRRYLSRTTEFDSLGAMERQAAAEALLERHLPH